MLLEGKWKGTGKNENGKEKEGTYCRMDGDAIIMFIMLTNC